VPYHAVNAAVWVRPRVALGLALAVSVSPTMAPPDPRGLVPSLVRELVTGLPVAVTAATALWVATMAGGLIDNLRAARESVALPNVEGGSSPTGALLSMLVALVFLQSGGPARVVAAVATAAPPGRGIALEVAATLTAGISLAVAVAAPLVAVALVVEVASALVARAASPAFVQPMLAPLRAVVILGVLAVVLERIVELLARYTLLVG
jgi:type III secretory pathway component EscT